MKKVCFFGPESTGKSFLAERLACAYDTEFVPEVAREVITSSKFTIEDIIRVGQMQTTRVKLREKTANKILICDTDLITTQIYSRQYLGVVPQELFELEKQIRYDLYFLFDIDVPWTPDGLRDLGHKRKEMYEIFRNELVKRRIAFIPVNGSFDQREALVKSEIDNLIGTRP